MPDVCGSSAYIRGLAQSVRELWRFKWRENRRKKMVGGYHTRGAGVPYFVRHTTRDIGVFSEVFVLGEYEPPR